MDDRFAEHARQMSAEPDEPFDVPERDDELGEAGFYQDDDGVWL